VRGTAVKTNILLKGFDIRFTAVLFRAEGRSPACIEDFEIVCIEVDRQDEAVEFLMSAGLEDAILSQEKK